MEPIAAVGPARQELAKCPPQQNSESARKGIYWRSDHQMTSRRSECRAMPSKLAQSHSWVNWVDVFTLICGRYLGRNNTQPSMCLDCAWQGPTMKGLLNESDDTCTLSEVARCKTEARQHPEANSKSTHRLQLLSGVATICQLT